MDSVGLAEIPHPASSFHIVTFVLKSYLSNNFYTDLLYSSISMYAFTAAAPLNLPRDRPPPILHYVGPRRP